MGFFGHASSPLTLVNDNGGLYFPALARCVVESAKKLRNSIQSPCRR